MFRLMKANVVVRNRGCEGALLLYPVLRATQSAFLPALPSRRTWQRAYSQSLHTH